VCAHSPECQFYPGLHPQQCGQQGEVGGSAPLLHSGETSSGVLLWSPQHRTDLDLLEQGQRRPEK